MSRRYIPGAVTDTTYLDARKQAVKGFAISVYFVDYDETIELLVPNINENTVKKAIEDYLVKRDAIANLGKES